MKKIDERSTTIWTIELDPRDLVGAREAYRIISLAYQRDEDVRRAWEFLHEILQAVEQ